MDDILIYDQNYLDILLQDFPPKDHVIVCLDPQHRLGKTTWAVLITTGDEPENPSKAMGLFWDKDIAIKAAEALSAPSTAEAPDGPGEYEKLANVARTVLHVAMDLLDMDNLDSTEGEAFNELWGLLYKEERKGGER